MGSLLRHRLVFRVILNGIILLLVSAAGFLGMASMLLGEEARQAERAMTTWFAQDACQAYARTPAPSALATYPVRIAIYAKSGAPLSVSTPDLGKPSPEEIARAKPGEPTPIESPNRLLLVCPDDAERYAVVGGPFRRPPLGRLSFLVAALVLLVAIGSIPLARSLVKPLRELVATAKRFGEGELSARAPVGKTDEIGDLASAFNAMAEKLEARFLAEKEMLANVSHELRTPLARVRVILETAKEDPERAASLLSEISRDLTELERLTDDVLTTVRLDFEATERATGLRLRPEEVDVAEVLRHAIARSVEIDPDREIELEAEEAMRPLHGDPALLRRLFANLLDNARKYSSSVISVRARDEGDAVVVDVEDHGIGVDPTDLERIFEPFFRSDRSRQRATGGTGLGLALCRRIVDLHHGSIVATSGKPSGTTVTVRLPRTERPSRTTKG